MDGIFPQKKIWMVYTNLIGRVTYIMELKKFVILTEIKNEHI